MTPETVERAIEALLFAADGPLSASEIAYRLPEGAEVGKALAALRARYAGRGVSLEIINDRWQFRTSQLTILVLARRPRSMPSVFPTIPTTSRVTMNMAASRLT